MDTPPLIPLRNSNPLSAFIILLSCLVTSQVNISIVNFLTDSSDIYFVLNWTFVHWTMSCGQKGFKLMLRCHQLLSGFLANGLMFITVEFYNHFHNPIYIKKGFFYFPDFGELSALMRVWKFESRYYYTDSLQLSNVWWRKTYLLLKIFRKKWF